MFGRNFIALWIFPQKSRLEYDNEDAPMQSKSVLRPEILLFDRENI